jgi:hypothetical protein
VPVRADSRTGSADIMREFREAAHTLATYGARGKGQRFWCRVEGLDNATAPSNGGPSAIVERMA